MRRPVTEIPQQPLAALGFRAQLEDLLFPKQIEGQGTGDNVGERFLGRFGDVAGQAVEEQRVASLIDFDELAFLLWLNGGFAIFEIVDLAFEKGILREKLHNAEDIPTDSNDVHPAIRIAFDDFQNLGGAANFGDAVIHGEQHSEGRAGVEAVAHHAAVAGLENVQGKLFAGEKYDVQRKERYAIGSHRYQGPS